MKIKIKKSKPIAKALIIKSKGSLPMDSVSDMVGGPMKMLMKSLMTSSMPKLPMMGSMLGSMPKPDMSDPEYNDRKMVLHALKSIKAIAEELEERACGCDPMPSWAEAKIYAAQKDILTVLGALMGREDKPTM
jgi:hypothetical protein